MVLPLWEHLVMSGDIFGSHNWGGRRYWHLVGGGQGCCSAPYSAQGIPPQRRTHRRRDVGGVEAWPLSPCVSMRSKVDKRPHSSSTPLCHLSVPVLFLPQVPALAPILWASLSGPPQTTSPNMLGRPHRDRSSQRVYSPSLQQPD